MHAYVRTFIIMSSVSHQTFAYFMLFLRHVCQSDLEIFLRPEKYPSRLIFVHRWKLLFNGKRKEEKPKLIEMR